MGSGGDIWTVGRTKWKIAHSINLEFIWWNMISLCSWDYVYSKMHIDLALMSFLECKHLICICFPKHNNDKMKLDLTIKCFHYSVTQRQGFCYNMRRQSQPMDDQTFYFMILKTYTEIQWQNCQLAIVEIKVKLVC